MTLEAKVANHGDANNVLSLVEAKFAAPISRDNKKPDDVLIHVRFHPNAQIFTIDSRPEHISPRKIGSTSCAMRHLNSIRCLRAAAGFSGCGADISRLF